MELNGLPAILFILFVFLSGYLTGMAHTVWMALIRFKAQGYTVDEHIQLHKLPEVTDVAPQEG